MPEVRDDSRVSRRWRLPALLTSIALVGGATMLRTTVERLHDQVCEVRRLRARLAERRRELERRRQELVTVATAVDGLVPVARALASRETAICQDRTFAETGDASPGPASEATSHAEDDAATRTPRAIAMLSWVEAQLANAGNAFAAQAALIRQRAQEARSVPTLWPVRGTVTSPFGWRSSPYGYGLEWHPGVDIQAAYGTPVRAAADGEVVFAGSARGYGALVVLDHGAALTRYARSLGDLGAGGAGGGPWRGAGCARRHRPRDRTASALRGAGRRRGARPGMPAGRRGSDDARPRRSPVARLHARPCSARATEADGKGCGGRHGKRRRRRLMSAWQRKSTHFIVE